MLLAADGVFSQVLFNVMGIMPTDPGTMTLPLTGALIVLLSTLHDSQKTSIAPAHFAAHLTGAV